MNTLAEYSALLTSRETMYRFLGRLYRVEVDQDFLTQLQSMSFPTESSDDELDKGYRLLEGYLQRLGKDPVTDLAVDYARIFLGAGIANGNAAYPYESVYTSPEKLLMQDARDDVVRLYRAKGLQLLNHSVFPEDHIALELEFMYHLCHVTQEALSNQSWGGIAESLQEQKDFLTHHLLNWVPDFCIDVEKYAATDFYKGVAKMTMGYLRLDLSLLTDLISEIDAVSLCGV